MNEQECLEQMVAPNQRRPGKFREGVMQIHLTRACDLACSNCTQGSQFRGKSTFISLENFEIALKSMKGYWGLIGIFGGNPALHPQFDDICSILKNYFPKQQCGIWCNNPRGKGGIMRETFNPHMSNLNCHLNQTAYDEFKASWPESKPFGNQTDSRHSPVHGSMIDLDIPEERRWELISQCDINQHWSAMICEFCGQVRGFFCEIAGSQAILNQHNPEYPDTGIPIVADEGSGIAWWQKSMTEFAPQVRQHCHNCLVPLKGHGSHAQHDNVTHVTQQYSHSNLKNGLLQILSTEEEVHSTDRPVIKYLGT